MRLLLVALGLFVVYVAAQGAVKVENNEDDAAAELQVGDEDDLTVQQGETTLERTKRAASLFGILKPSGKKPKRASAVAKARRNRRLGRLRRAHRLRHRRNQKRAARKRAAVRRRFAKGLRRAHAKRARHARRVRRGKLRKVRRLRKVRLARKAAAAKKAETATTSA
ncbi:hypothetical protein Y032_0329g2657 [Ancylostoma ceylanicum]|nr:hypothetical protein Y032_0329g2657 [Ancylostoma ceylanicum]